MTAAGNETGIEKSGDANTSERRTAVVMGSTSGIGRATALELARQGFQVVVHGRRSREAAEGVCREIQNLGRAAQVVMGDLSHCGEQDRVVEEAWSWRGGIDVWVHNAGVDCLTGEGRKWSFEEKLERLLQVDLTAAMRMTRDVGRRMQAQGWGSIVTTGWDQAQTGMSGDSGELFSAVKGAVMAFTRSLALSLAPQVRVNCVAPGWIRTSWGDDAPEYWKRRAIQECALQRWGEPEDVAQVSCFLASPAAQFVTGQIFNVNGGWRATPVDG